VTQPRPGRRRRRRCWRTSELTARCRELPPTGKLQTQSAVDVLVGKLDQNLGITDTAPAAPYRCPILRDTGYGGDTRGGAVDPIAGQRLQGQRHMRLGQLGFSACSSLAAWLRLWRLHWPAAGCQDQVFFYFTFSSLFLLLV
jgi:hypothetical protein